MKNIGLIKIKGIGFLLKNGLDLLESCIFLRNKDIGLYVIENWRRIIMII